MLTRLLPEGLPSTSANLKNETQPSIYRPGGTACQTEGITRTDNASWWRIDVVSQGGRNKSCQEAEYCWQMRTQDKGAEEGGRPESLQGHGWSWCRIWALLHLVESYRRMWLVQPFKTTVASVWECTKEKGENDAFQDKYEHGDSESSCLVDKVIVGEIHKAVYIFKKESSQTCW